MTATAETELKKRLRVPAFLNVPWRIRDLVVFGLAWAGIQVAVILLLSAVAPAVPVMAQFMDGISKGDITASFALNLLDAVVGLGLISLYLHKYGAAWSALGWRRVSVWKAVLYLVIILVVFIVGAALLIAAVGMLVPGFNADEPQKNEFIGAAHSHQNLALIALVLLPPVLEETIFRGFMFPAIAKRTGVVWGAVLSSIIFGFAHLQANVGIYTFLLGLLLCFMYVRTKSIIPGIFLHMINNYLAFWVMTGK